MPANEVAWPTGMSDQDPAARERPLVFNPQGFLVAILEDADQAGQARATLAGAGFADTNLRVYTSQQILDSWERFQAERSLAQRVAGAVTDDPDTLELYFGSARQGRAALWVHVPDEADAKKPSGPWPTTRSSTSATTATTAKTTFTSAEVSTWHQRREDEHAHNYHR
jgi:hypothetical protein